VRVAPTAHATLDRDFVLEFGLADERETGVRAWTDGEHTLVTVAPPRAPGAAASSLVRDAMFRIDISGPMGGSKLDAAKRAVSAALHGLGAADRFQLLAFSDRVETFAATFCAYDDATLARADHFIARLEARGGTELMRPLELALSGAQP